MLTNNFNDEKVTKGWIVKKINNPVSRHNPQKWRSDYASHNTMQCKTLTGETPEDYAKF